MSSKTKTTATKEESTPTLVPKLRFPEFRGTEGWHIKPFEKLFTIGNGRDHKHLSPGDIPVYGSGGYMRSVDKYLYDGESVCIGRKGTINNPMFLTGRIWTVDTLFYTHSFNQCLPKFIWAIFQQIDWLKHNEAGGIPSLAKTNIEKIKTAIPKPAEQQKIAECLSSVDELMAAQARKVDALKTHKKGLMQQLFPREGETQPRLRFPEFQNAGEWEESPLSKFILSLDAGVSVNSGDSRPANETERGVLKTSAITKGHFDAEENKVVLDNDELSRLREPVTGGTIIMCRKNTPALVGSNAYVESSHENLFLPDLLWAAKPREGVSMRFLAFILGSDKGRAALTKLAKGSSASMSNITKPEVLAFSVMAPSPDEQQRIASCLTSLDDLIAAQTQKHEALKTHKKGLMQQLFPSPEE